MHGGSRRDRGCRTYGEEGAPLVDLAARPPGPGAARRAGGAAVHAGQQRRHDGQLVSTAGLGSFFEKRSAILRSCRTILKKAWAKRLWSNLLFPRPETAV